MVEAGLCPLGLSQDGAQSRPLGDPVGHEPHFVTGVLARRNQEAPQAVTEADLKILLVSQICRPFRNWLISRSTTWAAFCMLPSASLSWVRVRQHGQRTTACTTISAQVTQMGY